MLILKSENHNVKKSIFKKRKAKEGFNRDSFVCNGIVFNVLYLDERRPLSDSAKMLINRFRGSVLCGSDGLIDKVGTGCLFEPAQYHKRACLSGVSLYMENFGINNLFVICKNFRFSQEWIDLARKCKKFILASATSIEIESFRDYCYKNLGLNIVTEASLSDSSFLTVRLDDAVCGQDYFYASHKNEDKKIFMDKSYFIPDECAKKLMTYNISPYLACAAAEVVPFRRIFVGKSNSDEA
ncbi:MAG: hypothetical protein IIX14_03400 [Clostridia bacterium]|nr:hypothetical protein [Clostridia bacterium]